MSRRGRSGTRPRDHAQVAPLPPGLRHPVQPPGGGELAGQITALVGRVVGAAVVATGSPPSVALAAGELIGVAFTGEDELRERAAAVAADPGTAAALIATLAGAAGALAGLAAAGR